MFNMHVQSSFTAGTVCCKELISLSRLHRNQDFSLKNMHEWTLGWLSVNEPVPPAIIAMCLNFRILGSDFLSGRMENWPNKERGSHSVSVSFYSQSCSDSLYCTTVTSAGETSLFFLFHHCTIALVHQQSIGSSEVHNISNRHVVQVLRHLPSLWKGGMLVLVVNLEGTKSCWNFVSSYYLKQWGRDITTDSIQNLMLSI